MAKATVKSSKKKLSKPWWIYSYPTGWKKFMQRLKMPQKIFRQEKLLNEQIMSPTISPINQIKNENLSPDMEIIKITTVVEAIRQKRQNSAQMLEVAKNIQKIIGKKRSKRSSYESKNNSTVNKDSRHVRQGKTFVSNKKSRYPNPNSRKQQRRTPPTKKRLQHKNTADLKTASNTAIPSTVFYKRIWEYINGTRPHSDIISDYNLESNSEKNSTCTDKEQITALQSQEDKLQVTNPDIKPERAFYKRIWDIINATKLNANVKTRSKRNASIPTSNTASTTLCVQEGTANYEENKQVQVTNEKTSFGMTEINSPEISNPGPYISGFWTVANKTQWQPKKIPIVNIAKSNNNLILSSLVNSASEVDDLNKFPDKVEYVADSSSDNSTGHSNEAHNSSQEIIIEPGPPYSSEESFAIPLFSPTKNVSNKNSQEKNQAERPENYSTGTTPDYDPLNIPYVEVPDYSDQQEDSLDKSNKSATAAKYKEYDDSDYDYNPKRLLDADDFSSKPLNAEIKVAQAESNEPDASLNANNSRSNCTEDKDSAECVDVYNVEDTKLRNNTENVTDDDIHRSAESDENENSDLIDFDINEYKKPIDWNEFFKNDPILESIRASNEYYHKENPNRTEESEEVETYATDPKEKSYDYFAKNEDSQDDYEIALDNGNNTKEETDLYAKKEAKESEKNYYPFNDKNFFKHIFEKDNDKESENNQNDNPDRTKEFEEVETYTTDQKEYKKNPDHTEKSEEVETYATDSREQSQDYFVKNEDYHDNHRTASDDKDKTNDREEENDSYVKEETRESDEDPYDDEDFFKHIFRKDNDKESSDITDRENEFLSHHFTEDVLRQLRDNSTTEEDRQKEESRNREDIQKTLSRILHKKDDFSRLDDNLNKMIEKGEAIPVKYNSFWSLKYESPHKRNENNEEQIENSKEEA